MANTKYSKMTYIEPLKHPFSGEIYNPQMYENCAQVEFNKDGSADIYDYNTAKHLMHI